MNEVVPNQQNLIIYNTLDGKVSVAMMARDGNVWMNQKQMAELFATSIPNVNIHISNILKENELDKNSVIKDYLITAAVGTCFAMSEVFPTKKWKPMYWRFTRNLTNAASTPMPNLPTKWTTRN